MNNLPLKYRIAGILVSILSSSWRIKISGNRPRKSGIVLFWHGYMLPGWLAFKNTGSYAVVSLSKDGRILSHLLSNWGLSLIRGSSSKGGREVLNEITKVCTEHIVLMTPDGPRGPKYNMKPGAVIASVRTGAPVYLCRISIGSKFIFKKSWDNFILPLPFSKVLLDYSKEYYFDNNLTNDEINVEINKLEQELNKNMKL